MQTSSARAGSIVIEFTMKTEELAKALRFQLRRIYRQRIMLALGTFLVACGVLVLAVGGPGWSVVVLLLGLVYLFWVTVLLDIVARRAARKSVSKEKSRWMEFSDDGVRTRTTLRESLTRWGGYSEIVDWGGFYFLRLGRARLYTIVPKRAFASGEEEREFRELVARHLSEQSLR